MKNAFLVSLLVMSTVVYGQVDTSFVYNTNMPFGTLDIRIAKSSTRYYFLQENVTVSYRENESGQKTNTFRDMTSWDSSPYTEGNLRERIGNADYFMMNYRLLFPLGYQPNYAKGYPLIVMMHGAGERGNCWEGDCYWATRNWNYNINNPAAPTTSNHRLLNNDHNLTHGGRQHLDARNLAGTRLPDDPSMPSRAFPGFVLFGQNVNGWDTQHTHDMIRLIRLVVKKYNIDPDRIYVHGLSAGGIAVYDVIKRAPWLFAAGLPMSSPSEAAVITQGMRDEIAHIPLWIFQGGRDQAPTPARTEGYIFRFREVGMDVRYSLYPNLGHGTWNNAYAEPDFFTWMLERSKRRIHVFYGSTALCGSSINGVRMGISDGFLAYQWSRNNSIISGATGNEYTAREPGEYRVRFSRVSRNPSGSQWGEWSDPVVVTGNNTPKPEIVPLTTTHLRGPDNQTPNIVQLKSSMKADRYLWYRNGSRINIPNNNMDDTVSILTITGTSTGNNGAYTLRLATEQDCQGPPSDPINVYLNNSSPYLGDSNIPTNFRATSTTGSTVSLAWNDQSSSELAFEIWRRAPGESFAFAGRVGPNVQSFTDRDLTPSTTYEYKIRIVNNQGRSRYAPSENVNTNISATTAVDTQPPTAPTNVRVVRNTISSISLEWDPATDDNGLSHYIVYFGSQQRSTESPETELTISGLPINTSYPISVRAVDRAGLTSPASSTITGTTSVSGLWYGHSTGAWTDLDEISNWDEPEFTGWVPNFTLEPRTQDEFFNFQFDGYLFIREAGNYYFFLNSNDGSRLYIDGQVVVDYDGVHNTSFSNGGFGRRSSSRIPLSAGAHEIRVRYFDYTEDQELRVAYQGPDTQEQRMLIPDEALTSGDATGTPTNQSPVVNITAPANNQRFTAPANITITATATDSDGTITKVEFFNGNTKLGEDSSSPYSYAWAGVTEGNYTIRVQATDNGGAVTTESVNVSVTGAPVVNVTSPADGANFTAPASITIAATASVANGSIEKVEFYNGTILLGEDATSPYSYTWENVSAGSYTILVRATTSDDETAETTVNVTVNPDAGSSDCFASGTILREVWTGVQYAVVAAIPLNETPDFVEEINTFQIPSNWGDNYGTRVSGYICPPATGSYVFWISSNDHSELWLSTNDSPENKQLIAWLTAATNPLQWNKFITQQSSPVTLVQGQRYYIEALHKEGIGTDHMAVGWQLPNGTLERPIPGNRLSPAAFEGVMGLAGLSNELIMGVGGDAESLMIFPNPATSGAGELRVSGFGQSSVSATVEIQRLTGEVVLRHAFSCPGGCSEEALPEGSRLAPGVYIVNMVANGKRTTQRLLIK